MQHRSDGFTAIELLVVVSIIAILSALAMPSFTQLMARFQNEKDIEALRASIMLARSEAMKRGGGVVIRKLSANAVGLPSDTCPTGRDWSCGWEVVNTNASPPESIRQYPSKGRNDIMLTVRNGATQTVFNRWGLEPRGFNLNVQHKTQSDISHRLCVSSGGNIRVVEADC